MTDTTMMTGAAMLEAVLDTFEWTYGGGENRGEVHYDPEVGTLVLEVWVHDNDDPDDERVKPLLVSQAICPDYEVRSLDDARDAIRALIHGFLTHEADEQMLFDGVRTYDPHART